MRIEDLDAGRVRPGLAEAQLEDLAALGLDWDDTFSVRDELTGAVYEWGQRPFVQLDPFTQPAHILTITRGPVREGTP